MIHKYIARALTDCLYAHFELPRSDYTIYEYGFSLVICSLLNTFSLLLTGYISGKIYETFILLIIFYTNQSLGGGYHAKTHFRCFLLMEIGLFLFIFSLRHIFSDYLLIIIGYLSIGLLFFFPLVLHENKKYLSKNFDFFVKRSRMVTIIECLFLFWFAFFRCQILLQPFSLSLFLSASSRIAGVLNGKQSNNLPQKRN